MTEHRPFHEFARRLRDAISPATFHPESLDDPHFQALALNLFQLQYEHIAAYHSLCDRRGHIPGKVSRWQEIPAMPTTAFKDWELTSLPLEDRSAVFHSSGTTEQRPSRHFHSRDSLALYEQSLIPWFQKHVQPDAGQLSFLALTPAATDCPHSSLIHMFEAVQRHATKDRPRYFGELGADGIWELRLPEIIATLEEACTSRRPVILLGTAFLFVHLLDELEQKQLRFALPTGSRLMETGGYKGRSRALPKAELHRLLSSRLGIPAPFIVCEYGMSELNSQAYDLVCGTTAARRFRFPPWARVVIVSPETGLEVKPGETGLVRIHDLANVWSVAVVQTEDLAVRHEDGFELIGRASQAEPRGCSLMAR